MRERKTSSKTDFGTTQSFQRAGAGWIPGVKYNYTCDENQTTLDEKHPWRSSGRGLFNIGGPFYSSKQHVSDYYLDSSPIEYQYGTSYGWKCVGPRVPASLFSTWTGQYPTWPIAATDNEMNGWGTSGINRTIPTSPAWSAAEFIGELHQQVPSVPGLAAIRQGSPRGIADEYLNYEFGIRPTISDVKKAVSAFDQADNRLRDLERGSGKVIRRRITLLDESQRETVNRVETLYPAAPSWPTIPSSVKSTNVTIETVARRRVWFSGAYSYYFKRSSSPLGYNIQKARKAFGLDISPEVAWNLTPWTWLVDWHTNIGDVMGNLSRFANDGLAMRWGYIMVHTSITRHFYWSGGRVELTREHKQRTYGYPYGFATNPPAYSPRQLAILGALGISKGPHTRF